MYSTAEALSIIKKNGHPQCTYSALTYHCRAMNMPMTGKNYDLNDEDIEQIIDRLQGRIGRPPKIARLLVREGTKDILDRAEVACVASVVAPDKMPWRKMYRFSDESFLVIDEHEVATVIYPNHIPIWAQSLLDERA